MVVYMRELFCTYLLLLTHWHGSSLICCFSWLLCDEEKSKDEKILLQGFNTLEEDFQAQRTTPTDPRRRTWWRSVQWKRYTKKDPWFGWFPISPRILMRQPWSFYKYFYKCFKLFPQENTIFKMRRAIVKFIYMAVLMDVEDKEDGHWLSGHSSKVNPTKEKTR